MQTQLTIPVQAGWRVLWTWQGIYLHEHWTRLHWREPVLHLIGDTG